MPSAWMQLQTTPGMLGEGPYVNLHGYLVDNLGPLFRGRTCLKTTLYQLRVPRTNVAALALPNKLARMAWAVLAKNELYRPRYCTSRPRAH